MRNAGEISAMWGLRLEGIVAMCLLSGCATVSPEDTSDREFESQKKAIAKAFRQTPSPIIPAEAQQHFDQGALLLRNSSGDADLIKAAAEFEECLRLAPWKADAYYNIGRLKELANDYDGAIRNYSLYLLASPEALDARSVQNTIGGLELKKPKTGAVALEGIWWVYDDNGNRSDMAHYRLQAKGNEVLGYLLFDKNYGGELKGSERLEFRARLQDRTLTGKHTVWALKPSTFEGIVSEDFKEINYRSISQIPGGYSFTQCLRR